MVRQPAIVLLLLCALAGCWDDFDDIPESELHARAQKMPLEERYRFYRLVRVSTERPPNESIAEDVALLGDPAWHYVFKQAVGDDFEAATTALEAFQRKCTGDELRQLLNVARARANDFGERTATVLSAEAYIRGPVCKIDPRFAPDPERVGKILGYNESAVFDEKP